MLKILQSIKDLQKRYYSLETCHNLFENKTILCKPMVTDIRIRTMMSGKSIYAARAAYYCAKALINPDVIDNTTKTNHQPLTKSLVSLSVDDTKGVVQHKTTLIKHGLL
jgi:hypothetical protein